MWTSEAMPASGWLTPKAEGRPNPKKGNYGVFAVEPIVSGEIVVVWGGQIMDGHQLSLAGPEALRLALQVEENLFIVSVVEGPSDWVNHSCEPNTGVQGQVSLVALRHIEPGEELCFDYAMTDGSPYDEFECSCGTRSCRGQIKGSDWENAPLWKAYDENFSPYLSRRIAKRRSFRKPRRLGRTS